CARRERPRRLRADEQCDEVAPTHPDARPINTPMLRIRSPCCARAASGRTAAPPRSVAKNFRRSMWLAM
ncbi:MAG TPA: hypothetical protein VM910_11770, partial [Bradyrhizobium sp.]|nr:hypothetical protein [Bradyrhizobium sp.]